jgi:hypothetical protein
LQERGAARQQAITLLQGFAATDLLSVALPETDIPDLSAPWTIEPALTLARRAEQALADTAIDDEAWRRIQNRLSQDYAELGRALTALSQQAQMEQTAEYGMVVTIIYQNRPERPDHLMIQLAAEIATRRELLSARERQVLENHLEAEIAAAIQRLLQDAERKVDAINKELEKRPTSTGVRFRLQWQPITEGTEGAQATAEYEHRSLESGGPSCRRRDAEGAHRHRTGKRRCRGRRQPARPAWPGLGLSPLAPVHCAAVAGRPVAQTLRTSLKWRTRAWPHRAPVRGGGELL